MDRRKSLRAQIAFAREVATHADQQILKLMAKLRHGGRGSPRRPAYIDKFTKDTIEKYESLRDTAVRRVKRLQKQLATLTDED